MRARGDEPGRLAAAAHQVDRRLLFSRPRRGLLRRRLETAHLRDDHPRHGRRGVAAGFVARQPPRRRLRKRRGRDDVLLRRLSEVAGLLQISGHAAAGLLVAVLRRGHPDCVPRARGSGGLSSNALLRRRFRPAFKGSVEDRGALQRRARPPAPAVTAGGGGDESRKVLRLGRRIRANAPKVQTRRGRPRPPHAFVHDRRHLFGQMLPRHRGHADARHRGRDARRQHRRGGRVCDRGRLSDSQSGHDHAPALRHAPEHGQHRLRSRRGLYAPTRPRRAAGNWRRGGRRAGPPKLQSRPQRHVPPRRARRRQGRARRRQGRGQEGPSEGGEERRGAIGDVVYGFYPFVHRNFRCPVRHRLRRRRPRRCGQVDAAGGAAGRAAVGWRRRGGEGRWVLASDAFRVHGHHHRQRLSRPAL
mmetsp:Transcript_33344/g.116865  ORF Transcript_33344/g.116865 Transcript_33344/m.116865 type:complete len:416 (+) Transcript_33344:609-1856(+)